MSTPTQSCGNCYRFNSIVDIHGKCRLSQFDVGKTSEICDRFVNKIRVEKEENGWFVVAIPSNERVGPFKLFNDLDATKLGPEFAVLPKRVFEAILAVPDSEVEKSPQSKPQGEGKRQSQADMLVTLALDEATDLFHDDRQVPYIRLQKSSALATLRLRSKEVKNWLAGLLWDTYEKAPNQEALGSALNVLDASAQKGNRHKLHNRVAPGETGSIWLDMSDDEWRAIHITKD